MDSAGENSDDRNHATADFYPGRLWSLWDMLRRNAHEYVILGGHAKTHAVFERTFKTENKTLLPSEINNLTMCIAFLRDECSNLNLPVSKLLFENAMNDIPETSRELKILFDCLIYELKAQLFLFLPPHFAKYYELALPGIITSSFPTASNELIAAGNTLATRFYTACVFHSMRGAEIGVRALGAALGVTFPNKPLELAEWQIILDQADSKIIAMKNMRSGTCKDEELKFYSQAGVQFRYFKDA